MTLLGPEISTVTTNPTVIAAAINGVVDSWFYQSYFQAVISGRFAVSGSGIVKVSAGDVITIQMQIPAGSAAIDIFDNYRNFISITKVA